MSKNIFDIQNKIVAITGGSGFLGKYIIPALTDAGAIVYNLDIKDYFKNDSLKNYHYIHSDFKNLDSFEIAQNNITDQHKKLDAWINCAYPINEDFGKNLSDTNSKSFRENVDLHLNGYAWTSRNAAEFMKKQGYGSIINFGSIYGMLGPNNKIYQNTPISGMPAEYAIIKGGIINFTRFLAAEYGPSNVRVNTLSPGGFNDGIKHDNQFIENYSQYTPMQRMGNVDEIFGPLIFLISDASSYVQGHNLVVDGGWSII